MEDITVTRGFVTIATGKEKYYQLAHTLVLSYKQTSKAPMPFALICDRENEYTAAFDDIVHLQNPTFSYLDKIELLKITPYDETIFIDADCIAFGDLNRYWDYFDGATDVSCFGGILPMDSKDGWFYQDTIGDYANQVSYIPHFHGGVYFIRRGDLCDKIYEDCMQIKADYSNYRFAYFKKPADEPIIALSMALHNCKPVKRHPECCAYFPSIHKTLVTDYFKNKCQITVDGKRENALLVHYATRHTTLPTYTIAKEMVLFLHKTKRTWNPAETIFYKTLCYLRFVFIGLVKFNYPKRVIHHIKKRFFSK